MPSVANSRETTMRSGGRSLCAMLIALCSAVTPALAQDWLHVEGLFDAEGWATDAESRLLAKNDGRAAVLGRVHLWATAELRPNIALLALAELETGSARLEAGTEAEIEQVILRYVRSPRLVIDVGRLLSPVGTFATRRFSTTNPLIGAPDSYPVTYPWGVQVAGGFARFDYRVAVVDLPVGDERYAAEPSPSLRPALGIGVTPATGMRFGMSFTRGTYLNRDPAASLPSGADWTDYNQRMLALDARFSRGYLEVHGELGLSEYDVPSQSEPVSGMAYYAEAKYTWTPRIFTAARLERNEYPLIDSEEYGPGTATAVNFYNGEVGAGYRISPATTLKASYRKDRWLVEDRERQSFPNGYALALQVSRRFDVSSWINRLY
jgi:hypothetical protein